MTSIDGPDLRFAPRADLRRAAATAASSAAVAPRSSLDAGRGTAGAWSDSVALDRFSWSFGGCVRLERVAPETLGAVLDKLREAGADLKVGEDWITLDMHGKRPRAVDIDTAKHENL